MDQRITIKIGGINYTLKVPSPEKEELMRTAAELVNRKLETLTAGQERSRQDEHDSPQRSRKRPCGAEAG